MHAVGSGPKHRRTHERDSDGDGTVHPAGASVSGSVRGGSGGGGTKAIVTYDFSGGRGGRSGRWSRGAGAAANHIRLSDLVLLSEQEMELVLPGGEGRVSPHPTHHASLLLSPGARVDAGRDRKEEDEGGDVDAEDGAHAGRGEEHGVHGRGGGDRDVSPAPRQGSGQDHVGGTPKPGGRRGNAASTDACVYGGGPASDVDAYHWGRAHDATRMRKVLSLSRRVAGGQGGGGSGVADGVVSLSDLYAHTLAAVERGEVVWQPPPPMPSHTSSVAHHGGLMHLPLSGEGAMHATALGGVGDDTSSSSPKVHRSPSMSSMMGGATLSTGRTGGVSSSIVWSSRGGGSGPRTSRIASDTPSHLTTTSAASPSSSSSGPYPSARGGEDNPPLSARQPTSPAGVEGGGDTASPATPARAMVLAIETPPGGRPSATWPSFVPSLRPLHEQGGLDSQDGTRSSAEYAVIGVLSPTAGGTHNRLHGVVTPPLPGGAAARVGSSPRSATPTSPLHGDPAPSRHGGPGRSRAQAGKAQGTDREVLVDVDALTRKQLRSLPLSHPAIMERVVRISRILSKTTPQPMPLVRVPEHVEAARAAAQRLHEARVAAAEAKRTAKRRLSTLRTRLRSSSVSSQGSSVYAGLHGGGGQTRDPLLSTYPEDREEEARVRQLHAQEMKRVASMRTLARARSLGRMPSVSSMPASPLVRTASSSAMASRPAFRPAGAAGLDAWAPLPPPLLHSAASWRSITGNAAPPGDSGQPRVPSLHRARSSGGGHSPAAQSHSSVPDSPVSAVTSIGDNGKFDMTARSTTSPTTAEGRDEPATSRQLPPSQPTDTPSHMSAGEDGRNRRPGTGGSGKGLTVKTSLSPRPSTTQAVPTPATHRPSVGTLPSPARAATGAGRRGSATGSTNASISAATTSHQARLGGTDRQGKGDRRSEYWDPAAPLDPPTGPLQVSIGGSVLDCNALLRPGCADKALHDLRSRYGRVFGVAPPALIASPVKLAPLTTGGHGDGEGGGGPGSRHAGVAATLQPHAAPPAVTMEGAAVTMSRGRGRPGSGGDDGAERMPPALDFTGPALKVPRANLAPLVRTSAIASSVHGVAGRGGGASAAGRRLSIGSLLPPATVAATSTISGAGSSGAPIAGVMVHDHGASAPPSPSHPATHTPIAIGPSTHTVIHPSPFTPPHYHRHTNSLPAHDVVADYYAWRLERARGMVKR